MRIIIATAFLLAVLCQSANAQMMGGCVQNLPALAQKLGVRANSTMINTVVVPSCDGRNYDLIALITALVTRMDKAAAVAEAK